MKFHIALISSSAFKGAQDIECEEMSSELYNTRTSYLSLKSSVLSPVSTRLTNQYLALEQLRAHYEMIGRAKARIDTSSPKSLQSSLSRIAEKRKEIWRTKSATSLCSLNGFSRTASLEMLHNHCVEKGTGHHPKLEERGIVSDGDVTVSDKVSWYLNIVPNLKDKYGVKNRKDTAECSRKADVNSQQQNISVADKISWYLEAVQQGAFTNELTSSVNGYSSDNQSSSSNELLDHNSSSKTKTYPTHGAQKINNSTYTIKNHIVPKVTSKNQVKSKLRNMKCYNPPTRRKKHLLKKKHIPVNHEPETHYDDTSNNSDDDDDEDENERQHHKSKVEDDQQIPGRLKRSLTRNDQSTHNLCSSSIRRYRSSLDLLSRSEEKYLAFLQNVTEDILNTGIYTDRAIKKALDFHMRRQSNLDSNILKQLMDQFLKDLCISKEGPSVPDALGIKTDSAGRITPPERDYVHFESNDNDAEIDPVFPISVTVTTSQTDSSIWNKDTTLDEVGPVSSNAELPDKGQSIFD